jgi:hypothetical protein
MTEKQEMNDDRGTLSDLWREERDACMLKAQGEGNVLRCIDVRKETGRLFIASIQTSQLGGEGGEGRWTRLESRSAVLCEESRS